MDPIRNPYAPGAGTQPPELAGRDELLQTIDIALQRIRLGRPAKSILMVGLRGVGKTVLLDRMCQKAIKEGMETLRIEAPEGRSLPGILAPQIRTALLKFSRSEQAKDLAIRGLRAIAGLVKGLKVKYNDIEVGIDYEAEPGLADNGDLGQDLQALLELAGRAAAKADTALILFIDELQYVKEEQLAALITALHRIAQANLPLTMVGAGLPQLRGQMGNAKSYAERLFDFVEVGALGPVAAREAIGNPAIEEGASFTPAALDEIILETKGYPYFLQEWGKHAWNVASKSPITIEDVKTATVETIAALDESFFRVRLDRLRPFERKYLRAMAELGSGPHRSSDIANVLGRKVTELGPHRNSLIVKGMIFSPSHGDTAFTVPLFDEFMKRSMPGDDWKN